MTKPLAVLAAAVLASSFSFAAAAQDGAKGARGKINAEYKAAKEKCEALKDKEARACKRQAKAKRDQARAELKK